MLGYLLALASLLLPTSRINAPSFVVTPDGTATMVSDTNATAFATFKLVNTGNAPANISLTCSSTGTANGCAVLQNSISLAAGKHAFVVVSYYSGAEGAGNVSLIALAGNVSERGSYITMSQPGARRAPTWVDNPAAQQQATIMAEGGGGAGGQASTPSVSIWAPSFSATANVFVSILWCDNGNPLNASSRLIRLNLVDVTSNFDYNNIGMDCLVSTAESQGTVTLSQGNNQIRASIANTWPKTGSDIHEILLAGPGAPTLDISMNAEGMDRSACVSAPAGPAGAFQCGHLQVAHSMPAFRTLDKDRTITLVYNSDVARSHPVIMADISLPTAVAVPDSLRFEVIIGTDTWSFSFSSAGLVPGGPKRRVALPLHVQGSPATNQAHEYTVRSHSFYTGDSTYTATQTGRLFLLDRSTSAYGAGWSVAGVDELFCFATRCMIAGGDGSTKVYEHVSTDMWVAAAGAYRDTLRYVYTQSPGGDTGHYFVRRDLSDTESFFNGAGNLRWVADRTGQKVEYKYLDDNNGTSPISWIQIAPHDATLRYNFTYSGGKLVSITDPAGRVLAASVSSGKLIRLRDPGFSSGTGEVQFGYDANARLTSWTSRLGHVTQYRFHGSTQLLHSDTLPATHAGKAATSFVPVQARGLHSGGLLAATYSSDSATVRIDGPRTDVADVTVAWVNRFGAPDSIQDALGYRTRIKYDNNARLLPIRIQSPNGRVVRMRYDSSARLVWSEDSTHSAGRDSVNYTYGNPAIRDKPTQVVTPLDATRRLTATFTYSSLGLLQQATDARGHTTVFRYTNRAQVDSIAEQNVPVWISTSQQRVIRDVDTRIRYDARGNHEKVITELGYQWTVRRDIYGNIEKTRNPAGDSVTYTYDIRNQLRSVTRYDTAGVYATTIGYDTAGNVVRHTDPRGVNRYWEYDALGRDTATVDEFNKREKRRYNLAGQIVTTVSRQGDSTGTKYDVLGRVERTILHPIVVNNSTEQTMYGQPLNTVLVPADTLKYEYGVPGFGGPTVAQNRQALIRRTYTLEGSLQTEKDSLKWSAAHYTKTYTSNRSGARASFTTPLGRNLTYSYTNGGELSGIGTPAGNPGITWHPFAGRDVMMLPDGSETRYLYDGDGRLRQIYTLHPIQSQVSGKGIVDMRFTLDAAGRPTSAVDESVWVGGSSGAQSSWRYDKRGQLISVSTPDGSWAYSYDASGNRIAESTPEQVIQYEIPAGTNRLIRRTDILGDYHYRHDDNGAVVSDSTYRLTSNSSEAQRYVRRLRSSYDAAGRLVRTQLDSIPYNGSGNPICCATSEPAEYRYDALGRMLVRPGGAVAIYDGDNVAMAGTYEYVHAGTDAPLMVLPAQYNALCMGQLEEPAYFVTHGNRLFDMHNENGENCMTMADNWERFGRNSGAIADSYTFDLSGSEGKEALSYFRNRFYDAETGRFTQEDPIGFGGGDNLYVYGGNNPASYTDPFGLCPEDKGGDGRTDRLDDCPEGSEGYKEHQMQLKAQQAATQFKQCMKDAAALGVAATGMAVGAVAATAGNIMQNQGTNAVAEGTRNINRFRAVRFPSSALIEDGIAMINNGRAAVVAGAVALKAGASIAAFTGGYGLGAVAMCKVDPTYYRE